MLVFLWYCRNLYFIDSILVFDIMYYNKFILIFLFKINIRVLKYIISIVINNKNDYMKFKFICNFIWFWNVFFCGWIFRVLGFKVIGNNFCVVVVVMLLIW